MVFVVRDKHCHGLQSFSSVTSRAAGSLGSAYLGSCLEYLLQISQVGMHVFQGGIQGYVSSSFKVIFERVDSANLHSVLCLP